MMIRRDYHVREIMAMSKEEVWGLPTGGLRLTFDNGEIAKYKTRSTIMSWYYWKLVAENPGLIITPDYHVSDDQYTTDSHVNFSSKLFWNVWSASPRSRLPGDSQLLVWELSRRIYEITNEQYNDYAIRLGDFVTGMDLEDLIDILLYPTVMEAKEKFANGELTVNEAHDIVYSVMTDVPELSRNPICMGVRVGLLNRRQITQMMGPRGYILDVNGEACRTPIVDGYGDGFSAIYDRFVESRTASLALYMASGPLEASEYFNRQAQFLCDVIAGVWYGDCGTTHYVPWQVRKGDMKCLLGKNYVTETGEIIEITKGHVGREEEFVGQVLNLRSFTLCASPDPTRPCSCCVGANARVTPPHANLGHYLSTEPLARLSQTILSTKHVIASARRCYLPLTNNIGDVFAYGKEMHQIHLTSVVSKPGWTVSFTMDDVMFINDILQVEDLNQIVPARVSAVQYVVMSEIGADGIAKRSIEANTSVGGYGSPLSLEFLSYMREYGWDIVAGAVVVKLDNWDSGNPFIITPPRGEDIMEILRMIKDFMHCPNRTSVARIIDFTTPGPAIQALMDIMNTKLGVNFTHAEVFVRAMMNRIESHGKTGCQMPVAGQPFKFLPLKQTVLGRGLGAALAYESQADILRSPKSYLREGEDIPPTPLDGVWGD